MFVDKSEALKHLDDVLATRELLLAKQKEKGQPSLAHEDISHLIAAYWSAVIRLAPPGSPHRQLLDAIKSKTFEDRSKEFYLRMLEYEGVVRSLRDDWAGDRLQSFQELIHAGLFKDILGMAEHLLEEGYKDAATVMTGGVLEEHLRKLCLKNGIPTTLSDSSGKQRPKKLDGMNGELAKASVYDTTEQKHVITWAALRNDAAHANYAKYDEKQIGDMISGIKGFIGRHLA